MFIPVISKAFTTVFGSRNERLIKSYRRRVELINDHEPQVQELTDTELRAKTEEFRNRIQEGQTIEQVLPEAMAVAREVMDRAVGLRNMLNPEHSFDPQQFPPEHQATYDQILEQANERVPVSVTGGDPAPAWMQVEIPVSLYHALRKLHPTSRPPFRARPFDVQLIGGMVLFEGKITEMKTGEGKTIVAPLACYLACLEGLHCHVVTVNDYLVQRDRDWVFPFYYHLGLAVGAIHPIHLQPHEKKAEAYRCHVLYGTNSEFGFDYLRDNMKLSTYEQVQKHRNFCIIDEVDSILIDEARTPLIISGPAHEDLPRYGMADQIARQLMQKQRSWDTADSNVQEILMRINGLEGDIRNVREKSKVPEMREQLKQAQTRLPTLEGIRDQNTAYYEVEREKKAAHLTHEGIAEAQRVAGIGSFYVGNNMDFPHLLENALRAHVVYQRDRDYVVRTGEVIIVDEFTGRLMIGRQWSDGLHQAVEAKENVKIKEESQTLATVTLQNFFKLYKRLAGMTGTAITEATEFDEIYSLDVACVPTNVPVIRQDRDDLIFLSGKDKWNAILDEIKRLHDVGRPVLVGTTSVENSEALSQMLTKKHGIKHEVLNAKVDQAEREAHIVDGAGELGAVMIATNMAGRGTDIKLRAIDRSELIRHWQQRSLLPREAAPDFDDEKLIAMSYRHQAGAILGMKPKELDGLRDEEIKLRLLRHWVATETMVGEDKARSMDEVRCLDELDLVPEWMLHRVEVFKDIEQMGGLHIVGTERHEARRIDDQLRGRSGRQGDHGSSRFFIGLEDDLMKLFAGKTTLTALSKLGMKEGDAIEHRWITKSVERAQRKVEERNYEIRKNLLEYDEVMEYQRNAFYGIRQDVLEGQDIGHIVFEYITDASDDAVELYLARDYIPTQVAEWCRQALDVSVDPSKLTSDDFEQLVATIRTEARDDAMQVVDVTLGEYLSHEMSSEEWDLRGLSSWAMSRFNVDLKQNQLRQMNPEDVKTQLVQAATALIDGKDLGGAQKFLVPLYAEKQLAQWARQKFGIELTPQELASESNEPLEDANQKVSNLIVDRARESYRQREVLYPIEFAVDTWSRIAQVDGVWAAKQLATWANQRYELGWEAEQVANMPREKIYESLSAEAKAWYENGKLEATVEEALRTHPEPPDLVQWVEKRFDQKVQVQDLEDPELRREVLMSKGRAMLRSELAQLERYVLLQILDTAWKDHLYAMDQLKDAVGLRGYAERDPRIEYKREGSNLFQQMQSTVRDRVTDLIFRARLTADVEQRSAYGQDQSTSHEEAGSLLHQASTASRAGTSEQRADLAAAEGAGRDAPQRQRSRKQRRAEAAASRHQKGPQSKPRKKRRR